MADEWRTDHHGPPDHGHRRGGQRRGPASRRAGLRHPRGRYPGRRAGGDVVRRPLALLVLAVAASSALWKLASRFPLPRADIGRWLVDVGPADAAMSVVRVAALGAAVYLAVIALLHLLVPTWSRAGRWVSTLTPPSLRAMLVTTVLVTSS